ncbi:MAG TPA: MFS transporter, partial [Thermoplasmataceae archaeon]|nr:MFS transporter [Thermoplasmataceae archaeon]
RGSFEPSMVKNWYIGLVISSLAVMFSSIASESLVDQSVADAIAYGGLFGGLSFLGSGLGAIILPPVFERSGTLKTGLIVTSVLSLLSIFVLAYFLVHFSIFYVAASGFFLFGFFGNSFWAMAMTSTTKYVKDPAQAGFATSMFSVATNLGVAFIPVFLGPFFLSNPAIGISIVVLMVLVAFAMSPTLRVGPDDVQSSSGEGAEV